MKEVFKLKNIEKLPSPKQWKQFFNVLTKKEKTIFLILLFVALGSCLLLDLNFYSKNTEIVPAFGGHFTEGLIGQPRFINPLYLSTQDVDRDIVELLFSGLMKYNEKGELMEDLVRKYEIKDEGKIFEVYLKNNVFWHDGKPLTSDDVIFTINLIQDPQYQSSLRIKWLGVVTEKISEQEIQFKLLKKYPAFLENLTLKILPKHIFEDITPKNLPWSLVSQNYLIGSGPFQFKELIQNESGYIKELALERNKNYYGKKPFLEEISFLFYQDIESLLRGMGAGEIDGFSLTDPKYFEKIKGVLRAHSIAIPRYFALFFNLKAETIFSEEKLREALASSINKEEILKNIFLDKGKIVNSPILPDFFGFNPPSKTMTFNKAGTEEILETEGFKLNPETKKREKVVTKEAPVLFKSDLKYKSESSEVRELQKCLAWDKAVYPEGDITGVFGSKTKTAVIRFQEKYATEILAPVGLKEGNGAVGPSTRKQLNKICQEKIPEEIIPLKLTLTTGDKFPLTEIAETIKKNWEDIGIEIDIEKVSLSDLQTNVLAKRNFELLLFGEALGALPDPFPFWHSSQREYPGLNIASYNSKEADNFLEKAREAQTNQERRENLEKFQDVLIEDLPAIFLVRPDYVYILSSKIKGYNLEKITEPAERLSTTEQWYTKTKRVWK